MSGMQVKDHIQALLDENLLTVEKIGSGNWYWSFGSEVKRTKTAQLESIRVERQKVVGAVERMKAEAEVLQIEEGEEGMERKVLTESYEELVEEVGKLEKEVEEYKDGDPLVVEERRREAGVSREAAERWTDNIGCLEGYLKSMAGGDREVVEAVMRSVYGEEFVEGCGLREWD